MASGDLLRRAMIQHTSLGEQARQFVERGLYVPNEIMVPAAMHELAALWSEWNTHGVVLDGFPRTREQAQSLDTALAGNGHQVQRVLFLVVPKDVLVARLASRWVCGNCGATYNTLTKPPRTAGRCDVCAAQR
jgi:adenylate kinase